MTSGSPVQVLATHTYAPNGHELSFTGASNHVITYAYDGLDRLIQTTFPDQGEFKECRSMSMITQPC